MGELLLCALLVILVGAGAEPGSEEAYAQIRVNADIAQVVLKSGLADKIGDRAVCAGRDKHLAESALISTIGLSSNPGPRGG